MKKEKKETIQGDRGTKSFPLPPPLLRIIKTKPLILQSIKDKTSEWRKKGPKGRNG